MPVPEMDRRDQRIRAEGSHARGRCRSATDVVLATAGVHGRSGGGAGGGGCKKISDRKESFLRTVGGPEPHEKRPLICVRGLS
jgi:hypothetical protein